MAQEGSRLEAEAKEAAAAFKIRVQIIHDLIDAFTKAGLKRRSAAKLAFKCVEIENLEDEDFASDPEPEPKASASLKSVA